MVSPADFLEHASNGTLHRLIVDRYERGDDADDDSMNNLAVRLHNKGEIDLLTVPTPEALAEVGSFQFFTFQQFYCAVIPKLEVEPLRLMGVVHALVQAAGNDMASNLPNAAFRDWCAAKPERTDQVLQIIEAGEALARDYLSFTLEAGAASDPHKYLVRAITYIREAPDLRLGAMTALARIDSSGEPDLAREALALMASLLDDQADDTLRTHVLVTAAGLFVRAPAALHDIVLDLMVKAIEQRGDGVLHHSASVLFNHRKQLSDAMIEQLLSALEHVKPTNLGTIDTLDTALSQLVKAGKGVRISAFLEALFRAHPDALSFKQFDSVGHALTTSERALCDDMAIRWLLSGDKLLASHISDLMGTNRPQPTMFDVNIASYTLSDTQAVFLARKAVGWFFFHPITAASLIICILRSVKGGAADVIGDLLFEPLLLNYSGELKMHLEERIKGPRDKAKPQIRRAVGKLDAYLDSLRATGYIAELEPSERERLIENQRQNEWMRQVRKQAEESSVLLSLVSKSIILHGNGSISYRRGPDGKLHRHEMKMGGFSTTWEAPRLQAIDPFGLDMQLRHFRSERLAS